MALLMIGEKDREREKGRTHFLGIGINEYGRKGFAQLDHAVDDVDDFSEHIIRDFYLGEKYLEVSEKTLYNEAATKSEIQAQLDFFKKGIKEEREENLIIYFAGHGSFTETFNTPGWALFDNDLTYTELLGALEKIRAVHILVISDACYSSRVLDLSFKSHINLSERQKGLSATRFFLSSGRNKVPDKSIFKEEMLKSFFVLDESISLSGLKEQMAERIRKRESNLGLLPSRKSMTSSEDPDLYIKRNGVSPTDLLETAKAEAVTAENEKKIEDALENHPAISKNETLLLNAKTYIKDIKTWRSLLENESELYTFRIEDYLSNFDPPLFRTKAKKRRTYLEEKERDSYISLLKNTILGLIEEAKRLGPKSEIRKELIRTTRSLLNERQVFITRPRDERQYKEINDEDKNIIWLLGRLKPYREEIDDFPTIFLETGQKTMVYCRPVPSGLFKQFLDTRHYPENYPEINRSDDESISFSTTWPDILDFCNWLSIRKGYEPAYNVEPKIEGYLPNKNGFRLPTISELKMAINRNAPDWEQESEQWEWCADMKYDEEEDQVEEDQLRSDVIPQESRGGSGRIAEENVNTRERIRIKAALRHGKEEYFSREEEIIASFRLVRKVS